MADQGSSKGNRYAELLRQVAVRVPDEAFSADIFERWILAGDDLDAQAAKNKLQKLQPYWTEEQQFQLLRTAEAIAREIKARAAWERDREQRERYKNVARRCVTAARLARNLLRVFPPPWHGDRAVVGQLITSLLDLAVSGVQETALLDHGLAFALAHQAVVNLADVHKKTPKHLRPSSALIAELAWLAGGKRYRIRDEHTIRRYRHARKSVMPPGAASWRNGWNLLILSMRLAGVSDKSLDHHFRAAFRDFLRGSRIQ
jgi:hypothetical protein